MLGKAASGFAIAMRDGRAGPRWARGCAILLAASAACGGGPKLTNLRCRETPCQDPEDPFLLHLAVDFDDPSGTLSAGALELYTNGALEEAVSLSDLFTAQNIDASATQGTLQVDEEVSLTTLTAGEMFTAGLQARNGGGEESNTPTLSLTLTLGSGN